MIQDKLQIFLITYNRHRKLKATLDSLLASPVCDFDIIVLDNASTDGSSEMLAEYAREHKNITHVRHGVNIGGNANICRAFEMAASCGREYAWILCDDDKYDWSNWSAVEEAITSDKYDLVFVNSCLNIENDKKDLGYLSFVSAFVPGVIYKTHNITSDIIQNMYAMICTWYPQSVLSLDVMCNNQGKIFVPLQNLIVRGNIENECENVESLVRGIRHLHPDMQRMFWHVGFIKVAQIIKNSKIRKEVIEGARFTEDFQCSFREYLDYILVFNREYKDNNNKNLFDVYSNLPKGRKVMFLILLIKNKIKRTIKWTFSIDHEHIIILGFKIKKHHINPS